MPAAEVVDTAPPRPRRPIWETETRFPNLRFDTGDVVIWLNDNPENTLVIHSEVLIAASPYFAGLKTAWVDDTVKILKHPNSGQDTRVKTYGLKWVAQDSAMTLDSNVRTLNRGTLI